MKPRRSASLKAATAGLALVALGTAGVAQARDVYWSVGINAAPGVAIGVANTPPVVVAPAPVYVAPQPVYVAPAPVVYPSGYYVRPAPVYYAAPVCYGPPGHCKHKWKKHHRHDWDD